MASIKHCGHHRRTQKFWLNSDDPAYQYQYLMTATCPKCEQFIMEYCGVGADMRMSPPKRISQKQHDKWIARTDPVTGDLSKEDSSQWHTKKEAVVWVNSSSKQFPWNQIRVRVR